MSSNKQFVAVFVGGTDNPQRKAWDALSETEQRAKGKEGIDAWGAWAQTHQASIVLMGGPLGKTKKVDPKGIADISNLMAGFTIVQADSHEAAAKLFENHPHFSIFGGAGVEIMPILPIPGM
jgi:hypothetical protein